MKRILKRIAAIAVAVPLAVGLQAGAAQANHGVTVPGCYGAAFAVYCDVRITVGVPAGVGTYQTEIPVCAGTCVYVPVTWVTTTPGEPTSLCVSYRTLEGGYYSSCYDASTVDPWVQYVNDLINGLGPVVDSVVEIVRGIIENLDPSQACYTVANVLSRYGIDIYCQQ